ncbi:MAG: hypothetical protein H8E72_01315 [Candidatus Marinimicrobia bacterium]|nr:hypothetical protein [Candidatus Neomarinimicrobiota bacterium]
MKTTFIKHIIFFTIISFSFAIEFSTQKLEMSFDSPYNQNLSIQELLDFETIGFTIGDLRERNQFYRSISHSIHEELSAIEFRLGTMEMRLRRFIYVYEEKLDKDHFQFHSIPPEFNYRYRPLPLDQSGIDNDIFYKEAITLKSQYLQRYKFYKSSIEQYKDYLFELREAHFYNNPHVGELVIFQDDEFEELFYENVQSLLREKLIFQNDESLEFMKVFRDTDNKVLSMNWFTHNDSLIRSRDFEYFDNGLLAAIRERVSGLIIQETLYGQNEFSRKFYEFIFSPGFLPSHYDHMTEVNFNSDLVIKSINFLKLNGDKIGSINYTFDENDHLVNEVWRKGKMDSIVRKFICSYEEADGSYRIVEKDKYGRIVFQDIVSSQTDEKFKEDTR